LSINNKKLGFTLIELLVVVAIIGILAAVGVVAYNGYTASAKRNATLANFKTVSKLIHNTFQLCEVQDQVNLSPTRMVNCSVANTPSGIGQVANVFLNYVKENGFKNPYDNNAEIIKYTGSGGDTVDGRMRLDYEACKIGTKLNLWVKTHKETLKESHSRDGWCTN
jgi:type IV pilus assembly protein PilA